MVPARTTREEMVNVAGEAINKGRVFLTRDHKLAAQRGVDGAFLLGSDCADNQLREVSKHFGIRYEPSELFSRCRRCNSAEFTFFTPDDVERPIEIPRIVYKIVKKFWRCANCGQIFWIGIKSQRALNQIMKAFHCEEKAGHSGGIEMRNEIVELDHCGMSAAPIS